MRVLIMSEITSFLTHHLKEYSFLARSLFFLSESSSTRRTDSLVPYVSSTHPLTLSNLNTTRVPLVTDLVGISCNKSRPLFFANSVFGEELAGISLSGHLSSFLTRGLFCGMAVCTFLWFRYR